MTFLWGTATAAHQNEGDNVASDWWDYEQKGRLPFRMSVEWARLEPEAGKWDEAALGRYVEMVADLRRRGIEPVVTLHHFVLPLWFARAGGFEKREEGLQPHPAGTGQRDGSPRPGLRGHPPSPRRCPWSASPSTCG